MKNLIIFSILFSIVFSQQLLKPGQSFTAASTNYILDEPTTIQLLNFRTQLLNLSNEYTNKLAIISNDTQQIKVYENIIRLSEEKILYTSNLINIERSKQLVLSNTILAQKENLDWMNDKLIKNKFELFIEKYDAPVAFCFGAGIVIYAVSRILNVNFSINK